MNRFTLVYSSGALAVFLIASYVLPTSLLDVYVKVSCTILSLILIYLGLPLFKRRFCSDRLLQHNKAVFITGCDSGFGHELAKRLDTRGFRVFATCLFPDGDGANALRAACSDRLRILYMDVTKQNSIEEALTFVKGNLDKSVLWAVVNNAGVYRGYNVALTKIECFEQCLDVNSLGMVRVTKAFLPLLKISKGRVVNVTSLAGHISFPYGTAYHMSKFAALAFCDCLRLELKPWDIQVISIEPEFYRTPMFESQLISKGIKTDLEPMDEEALSEYSENFCTNLINVSDNIAFLFSKKIDKVIDCLEDAITLAEPDDVYIASRNSFIHPVFQIMKMSPRFMREVFIQAFDVIFVKSPKPKITLRKGD